MGVNQETVCKCVTNESENTQSNQGDLTIILKMQAVGVLIV